MGGVLSLYHASFLPAVGVIAMSTPYQLEPGPKLTFLPILSRFVPYAGKGKSDWKDPDAEEDHFSYARYPTRAILQLNRLIKTMQKSLPDVKMPALLIHSKKDSGVIPENMNWISSKIGTPAPSIKKIWLENSGHVVTRDLEKDLVFESIGDFIQEVLDA